MKFWEIFRFEFAYQIRRTWPWLFFAVLLVLSFLMTRDGSLSDVLYADFFLNSPFAVAKTTVFGSLVWLVAAAAVAGDAASRDVATGMHPLTYTLPVSKTDYLGGRFLAALTLNALILLGVQAGILLGVYLPGVHPDAVGPFRVSAYATAYAFIALPNAFAATAIQFALAARSGRAMASYVGSFLIVFMGFFVASFLLFKRGLGTLLDPIGIRFIVEDVAHLWTTAEKSWRLLTLDGIVLQNRLLWVGVGVGALALTHLTFRLAHRVDSTWWRRSSRVRAVQSDGARGSIPVAIDSAVGTPARMPQIPQTFGFATHARQTLAIASDSFRAIALSWAGLALLVGIPLLTVPVVLDQTEANGIPLLPTTSRVIAELTASLSDELSRWVIIPFLIVFFAGELVWRERDARLAEITDAIPGSEWTPLLGKFLGLGLVLTVFMAMLTMAGMLAQVARGYQHFEPALYLKIMFGLQLPEYLLFALLALLVHVLVNQKYVGHLVAIMAYVFIALASLFGVEHNLLIYAASPKWSYTEMRGFGPSLAPWVWFKLYWAAWALLLAVVAKLFWARGRESSLRARMQLALHRFTRTTAWTAAAAAVLILSLGGFIFYNTNMLNAYQNASDLTQRRAEYERRYRRYADTPQPQLTATKLHVEIYPERREVEIRGSYHLVNRSVAPIDSIHIATAYGAETRALVFDRPAAPVLADESLGHKTYRLDTPLQPGESLRLDFEVYVVSRGFGEGGVDDSIAANGTHFTNGGLPAIGYQSSRELTSASDRRTYGLASRPVIPSLYDVDARDDRAPGVVFEAVVGTQSDQVAVAPGALRRTWTKDGRRYFHYATDGPIGGEWAFFSANYAVHEAQWTGRDGSGQTVAVRIVHHPGHTMHLDRVVQSIRASLDYYTEQFGPYRSGHISVVERPGNGTGMHAETGLLSHAEGFSLWNPQDNGTDLDLPFAVVAHEMAHQWTIPYAFVEGAPVMSESLAWYYAMRVVEQARGPEQLRRLLSFMRQPHPIAPIRRGEPLLRGLDQYLAYRKGPFALYALSEYVGAERVNGALRRLLEAHRSEGAPLATTLDLYRELQAVTPASVQFLLHDFFTVNTVWEFETDQVTATRTEAGSWEVALDVRARKVTLSEAGVETEVPMDDLVEIGVFGDEGMNAPLYLQLHRITTGTQRITVTLPQDASAAGAGDVSAERRNSRSPARAGIDPRRLLLIDPEANDNVKEVETETDARGDTSDRK